jgi:hypothetical protein
MRVIQHRIKYSIPVNGDLLDPDWDDDDYEWLLERIRCTGRSDIVGPLGLVTQSGPGATDKIHGAEYMASLHRNERLKLERREARNARHDGLSGVCDTGH